MQTADTESKQDIGKPARLGIGNSGASVPETERGSHPLS